MLSKYNFLKVKLCYRTYWKQWLAFLAICLFVFACSSDSDNDSSPSNPTNFYEAHVGVWLTTVSDGSQALLDIFETGWDAYSRVSSGDCWSSPNSVSGNTTLDTNTPDELTACTSNIPASDLFTGDDLQIIYDAGYSNVSICQSYIDNGPSYISFAQIFYAGFYDVELFTISGNFGKQSSNSFEICKVNNSYHRFYMLTEEAKKLLISIVSN